METNHSHEEDDILASTLSTHDKPVSTAPPRQRFERANLLLPATDLRLVDGLVHELKALGLRWVNRSLLVRFALASLKDQSAPGLAKSPDLLRLGK